MAEAAEDRILTKVLGVSLQFQSTEKSGIIFLADLAQVSALNQHAVLYHYMNQFAPIRFRQDS